jgi:predicted DNA-binding protein (MmcQ/YjbR family)
MYDSGARARPVAFLRRETMGRMDAMELRAACLRRPGAVEDFPFGPQHSVFKVAGKIFALSALDRVPLEVSVKCEPELATELRRSYPAIRPGYHLNKRHWNTVTIDGSLPDRLVHDMIEDSYDLVVSALPRRVREQLGWSPGAEVAESSDSHPRPIRDAVRG